MADPDYALGRTNTEYDRLSEQAANLRPLSERMLRAAGICSGMHVLDVGCGAGDLSFLLSVLVGPEGSVLGCDLDANVIERAESRRATYGIANVQFRHMDVRSVGSQRLFDAAVGRLVLMYIRDVTGALRLIAERVRPSGILAFQEWIYRAPVSPNQPVLGRLLDLIARTFERSGAHLQIGAELYQRMLDAGLEAEHRPLVEIPLVGGGWEVAYRQWAGVARSLLPKMVEYGLATEAVLVDVVDRQLLEELREASECIPVFYPLVGQWGRKR